MTEKKRVFRFYAEKGIKPTIEGRWFESIEQLEESGFDYDYYHKMEVLESHPSERYKKKIMQVIPAAIDQQLRIKESHRQADVKYQEILKQRAEDEEYEEREKEENKRKNKS